MNVRNAQSVSLRVRDKTASLRNRIGAGALVAMSSVPAFAQAPDTTDIEANFVLYGAAAVGLIIAFCAVLWSIRGASLMKPKQ
ncbi:MULTISPECIES: hypothetical protein [Luteimonas]|uniref:hypothetical protein n=1 Tax=Luteimonas TaxID=83614 RepID=UPI000C7D794A|nr:MULTISPECIES: hypothetical protein [Luteimonas]